MRKIAVITGSRAEYGLLKPVISEIKESPELELIVIATGMHLMEEKGYTVEEVKKDFKVDAEIDMEMKDDKKETLVKALGTGIKKFVDMFVKLKPDIVVVLGDRNESFAAAIAASQLGIPVAHIHGGDITNSGTIDESIRYSITNFSHIHFAATKKSAERLKKAGEEEKRIHEVGSPGIDGIRSLNYLSKEESMKRFDLDKSKPFVLLVHNPVTIDPRRSLQDLKTELEVLSEIDIQVVAVHPNADSGSVAMANAINLHKNNPNFKIYENIAHADFLNLLKYAEFLIGNSTSGIIEAASLKTPVLNIGERQTGREYFGYIRFLKADKEEIKKEINIILNKKFNFPDDSNPYGDGTAAKKIADVLINERLDFDLIKKKKHL